MSSNRIHNTYQNMTSIDAINSMISESGRPEKAIAADIGKPLSTLQRELNPTDEGAKLGFDTLFPLIRSCCGDDPDDAPEPLVWLCRRLGFVPVKVGAEEPTVNNIHLECMESSQSMSSAHKAILDGKHPDEVDALLVAAKSDLDQDATLYRRQWEITKGSGESNSV